jgi:protein-S-isoprenylcysteine O-methyltransferase Ste14
MNAKSENPKQKTGALRWLIRETLGNLILIAMLFGIVGRLDWWNGWAMSAAYLLWSLGCIIFIMPVNPQMLAERSRPQAGSKKWDVAMVGIMGVFLLTAYAVACLDVRFGWAPSFPMYAQVAGAVVAILGYDVIMIWSMIANAFFSTIVRIQTDRQHIVATKGPYRFVRHPGYVGTILFYLATPFLFGSRWALIPAVLAAIVLIMRTALEDKTLQEELPGYKKYAERVRFRLLPGIW